MEDTMRRSTRMLVLMGLWAVLAPREAAAGLGWLEKLSGPGPFRGFVYTVPVACYRPGERADFICTQKERSAGQPRAIVGIDIARFWTSDNPLVYPRGRPGPKVQLFMLVPSLSIPVHKTFTIGTGFGWARFTGEDDAFPAFSRGVYQPVRLTVMPVSAFTDEPRWSAIQFKFNANMFTSAIRAEDFGAVPGTFKSSHEVLWEPVIFVDVLKLVFQR
jgi:hypothetical protein